MGVLPSSINRISFLRTNLNEYFLINASPTSYKLQEALKVNSKGSAVITILLLHRIKYSFSLFSQRLIKPGLEFKKLSYTTQRVVRSEQ